MVKRNNQQTHEEKGLEIIINLKKKKKNSQLWKDNRINTTETNKSGNFVLML